MKQTRILLLLLIVFAVSGSFASAKTLSPKEIITKKYPRETVVLTKTADLNGDKKNEHFALGRSGNVYYIDAKGQVNLIDVGFISDDGFEEPTIQVFSPNSKTKHVAFTFEYGPSNTVMTVYQLNKEGKLTKALEVMGDLGVKIDSKGRVHQYWKKYQDEGGWDQADAMYTWSATLAKYKGSGQLPY